MKRIIVLLLAALMLTGILAGCGAQVQHTDGNILSLSQPKEVPAGTLLDAPEVAVDTDIDKLYIRFLTPGEEEDSVQEMEIAVDQVTEDTYVLYVTNGMLKLDEAIYEVSDSGITKYYKNVFMVEFVQETEADQQTLQAEVDTLLGILSYFMLGSKEFAGVQYRKSDEYAFSLTGDTYVYDVIRDGVVESTIQIHQDTGLLVDVDDPEDNMVITIQEFKTRALDIPDYK